MSVLSLFIVLSLGVIQSASGPTDSFVRSENPPFTRDFKMIESLGQAKDSVGLENMVAILKARWKDVDMDCYCRLMQELLGCLRTDFNPVDYAKLRTLSDDVLSDLEMKLEQGTDPVLVPHYYESQLAHLYLRYAPKYSLYTFKGDTMDEAWMDQRKDVMARLLKVWKLLQDVKDPTWDINEQLPMNVEPPDGGSAGISPESIKDPILRAKYEDDIRKHAERLKLRREQYELWKTERNLRKRLMNDIKPMYTTPPLAPDELKNLLDLYVKDEETKKMFLEASQE
jgi:hypothetical protein